MEPPHSSPSGSAMTVAEGSSPPAASTTSNEEGTSWRKKIEDLLRGNLSPDIAAYYEERQQELIYRYISKVAPMLRPVVARDSVKDFHQLYCGWSHFMARGDFLLPEILCSMVSANALRCAKVALEGRDPLEGRRVDPSARHRYGFAALHLAAETFSVDMVKLLLRHGASTSVRTEGERVIEGLLPLHVAVNNASMHKYLEDNWDNGDPVDNLIFLLCLPEMKIFLDTTRLIAKHTDNIVDEVWAYINKEEIVQAAILLLAAQKQLCEPLIKSTLDKSDIAKVSLGENLDAIHREVLAMVKEGRNCKALKKLKDKKEDLLTARMQVVIVENDSESLKAREVSLNGFDIVKSRIDEALDTLHLQGLDMVRVGKNGKALKNLKDKKEILLTAHALVGIIDKAGEALEGYIQTHSEVTHEEIFEHVSSILYNNGIVHFGKGIDTGNLESYRYRGSMSSDKSGSQKGDKGTNEADKSSQNGECSKKILRKEEPKRLALRGVRNMFFPYWKSVLSTQLPVKMSPPCQPSRKDMRSTEPSSEGVTHKLQSTEPSSEGVTHNLYFENKPVECPSWLPRSMMSYAARKKFASMSLNVIKRV